MSCTSVCKLARGAAFFANGMCVKLLSARTRKAAVVAVAAVRAHLIVHNQVRRNVSCAARFTYPAKAKLELTL